MASWAGTSVQLTCFQRVVCVLIHSLHSQIEICYSNPNVPPSDQNRRTGIQIKEVDITSLLTSRLFAQLNYVSQRRAVIAATFFCGLWWGKAQSACPQGSAWILLTEMTNGSYGCLPLPGWSTHFLGCFGLPQPHQCISLHPNRWAVRGVVRTASVMLALCYHRRKSCQL